MNRFEFEWDPDKAVRNLQKHGVSFEEASTVFDDDLFISFLDEEHWSTEERYITVGVSNQNRLLMVAHTERGVRMRIISARSATRSEERYYEESG